MKKLPSYEILKVELTKIYLRSFLKDVVVYRFVQLFADDFGINLRSAELIKATLMLGIGQKMIFIHEHQKINKNL